MDVTKKSRGQLTLFQCTLQSCTWMWRWPNKISHLMTTGIINTAITWTLNQGKAVTYMRRQGMMLNCKTIVGLPGEVIKIQHSRKMFETVNHLLMKKMPVMTSVTNSNYQVFKEVLLLTYELQSADSCWLLYFDYISIIVFPRLYNMRMYQRRWPKEMNQYKGFLLNAILKKNDQNGERY